MKKFLSCFRYALLYLIGIFSLWLVFSIYQNPSMYQVPTLFSILLVVLAITLYFSRRKTFARHSELFSIILAGFLVCAALLFTYLSNSTLSHFAVVSYTIVVVYTVFPLPPYVCLIICVGLSAVYEIMEYFNTGSRSFPHG